MANLSKDLKNIFNKYLERKENERFHPRVEHESYFQPTLFSGGGEFKGVIYFYEWSDVTRTPKSFYSLEKFEDFLESCNIYLLGYQREILKNMRNPYVACKRGTKELIIKVTYEALKGALNTESSFNLMAMPQKEPYQVAVTRPPMKFELENRYPDMGEFNEWLG
jgi:hypothetical protein